MNVTLPETNIALKIDPWKRSFLLGNLREGSGLTYLFYMFLVHFIGLFLAKHQASSPID